MIDEPLIESARFGLPEQRFPDWDEVHAAFVFHVHDSVTTRPPRWLRAIVALPQTHWHSTGDFLDLYAFGTHRSDLAVILRLAEIGAPAYLATGLLPLIRPIRISEWHERGDRRSRTYRRIKEQGLLAYWREY